MTLKKLLRYKVLHIRYVCKQPGVSRGLWRKLQLVGVSAARFAANCVAVFAGFENRIGHQAARAPSAAELAEWRTLWNLLAAWYGRPSSETFRPASLLTPEKDRRGRA
jgi:hypothetical protein